MWLSVLIHVSKDANGQEPARYRLDSGAAAEMAGGTEGADHGEGACAGRRRRRLQRYRPLAGLRIASQGARRQAAGDIRYSRCLRRFRSGPDRASGLCVPVARPSAQHLTHGQSLTYRLSEYMMGRVLRNAKIAGACGLIALR